MVAVSCRTQFLTAKSFVNCTQKCQSFLVSPVQDDLQIYFSANCAKGGNQTVTVLGFDSHRAAECE